MSLNHQNVNFLSMKTKLGIKRCISKCKNPSKLNMHLIRILGCNWHAKILRVGCCKCATAIEKKCLGTLLPQLQFGSEEAFSSISFDAVAQPASRFCPAMLTVWLRCWSDDGSPNLFHLFCSNLSILYLRFNSFCILTYLRNAVLTVCKVLKLYANRNG